MLCPQSSSESWLPKNHLNHNDVGCTGKDDVSASSLVLSNSMFRIPIRLEDRGDGNRIGGTKLTPPQLSRSPNLWAEGYFDLVVTPYNFAPKPSNPHNSVFEVKATETAGYGYPKGRAEEWWGDQNKAKYVKPVNVSEYGKLYQEGANTTWAYSMDITTKMVTRLSLARDSLQLLHVPGYSPLPRVRLVKILETQ